MINLNIAGAAVHYNSFINKIPVLKLRNKEINFNVYEGPNLCQWNGGRINRDIILSEEMINRYNKLGITVSLTFTNPTIDLTDPIGNELLRVLSDSQKMYGVQNKIILVNEELRKYLRNRYDFELIYSITGHPSAVKINDELINYYLNLESKYDWVVPKFEVVFQPRFIENTNCEKYELLINDTCVYGCPYYFEHFRAIAEQNTLYKNPWEDLGHIQCHKVEECWLPNFNPDVGSQKQRDRYGEKMGMDYTKDMLIKALQIGYKSFKLSGRENTAELVTEQVATFLKDIK